ncbi:MAG: glycoside hydrolase family 92 protein [Bacteroidetes bacterium]|nr:glycoside hydrolase family 92 protein [Bacteroidota bacterium]
MKFLSINRFLPVFLAGCILIFLIRSAHSQNKPSDFVKPLIGTNGEGNTYPGAVAPFGMIQLSPDTEDNLWETASGYEYSDSSIIAFSLTHFSGTGIPDLGDIRFMPQIGKPWFVQGPKSNPDSGYRSRYAHTDEEASTGYYSVKLKDNGVRVEATAANRAGMFRFTFPASDSASILVDLSKNLRWNVIWSNIRVVNDSTITGFHMVNGWAKERYVFFTAVFSKPFRDYVIMSDGKKVFYNGYRFRSSSECAGKNIQFLANYTTSGNEQVLVRVGISSVSAENSGKNLQEEIRGWNFEQIRLNTRKKWDAELGKVEIEGTQDEKETFYTALYHAFLTPVLFQDVDGSYRGLDQNIRQAKGFTNYAIFSLWDTYRATHPLFCLLQPKRNADMINSMLAHYDQSVDHLLPVWSLCGNETWCMIGYHAVPVIVDAYLKGISGFDAERAYSAIKTTAMNPDYDNVKTYATLGWVPFDKENESVSKTLEYAHDDFCIAQMAKALGKNADYEYFLKRSMAYKNLFDKSTMLMRGRDSKGNWRTPFKTHEYVDGGDFTEATSWQYSWYVPQDIKGLIDLQGGNKSFCVKLDSLFTFNDNSSQNVDDIQGRLGEYWHGNEPSHHIIFLYDFAGQPWKTQELVHKIIRSQYGNKPNSLSGNDDCGQMSSWYLFNAMGFYPVCPGTNYYAIGSPVIPKATIHLAGGKDFIMKAENLSDKNVYIQKVMLNGKACDKPYFMYDELKNGGELVFTMGPKPNKKWGGNVDFSELNLVKP